MALILLTSSAALVSRPTGPAGPKVSATISFAIDRVDERPARHCVDTVGQDGGIPGPDGRTWIRRGSIGWCEHRAGRLVAEWRNATIGEADRMLTMSNGQAFLGFPPPLVTNMRPYREGECGAATPALTFLQQAAPDYGGLTLCQQAVAGPIQLVYALERTDAGPLPYVRSRLAVHQTPRATMIYLLGGPYGRYFSGLENLHLLSRLMLHSGNVETIVPLYIGNHATFVEDADNVTLATLQIEALLDQIDDSRGDRPVCVIGGSLGGYIAAGLRPREGLELLLISPLVSTPSDFANRFLADGPSDDVTRVLEIVSSRTWREGNFPRRGSRHVRVRSAAGFINYFGSHRSRSLAQRLGVPRTDVRILYGSADTKIGLDAIGPVRDLVGAGRVVEVGPVGHEVEQVENYWAFEPHVSAFVQSCGRERPTA